MIMCNYRKVFFLSWYATFLCSYWNSSRQSANAEIFAKGNKVFFLFVSDRKMPKNKKKEVLEKKDEDLDIFTCYRNWNLLAANIFSVLFVCLLKYHCWSSSFCPYLYYGMLGSLHHASMNTFVLRLIVSPPLLFPLIKRFFYKEVYLKWNEMKSILFFFFEQLWRYAFTFVCFSSFKFMRCLKECDDKISKNFDIFCKS